MKKTMTTKQAELINKLNKISANYTVTPEEICYEYPSAGLIACLKEASIEFEMTPRGLWIAL